jgi:hypothetical protein
MKKLIMVSLMLMISYVVSPLSIVNAAPKKASPKSVTVCLAGTECFTYETAAPIGIAKSIIIVIEEVFEKAQHAVYNFVEEIAYAAVERYMAEHPCECSGDASTIEASASDNIATFPAIFPPVFTGELSGLWAPPNHIVQDTKVDMWLQSEIDDKIYYLPLFR